MTTSLIEQPTTLKPSKHLALVKTPIFTMDDKPFLASVIHACHGTTILCALSGGLAIGVKVVISSGDRERGGGLPRGQTCPGAERWAWLQPHPAHHPQPRRHRPCRHQRRPLPLQWLRVRHVVQQLAVGGRPQLECLHIKSAVFKETTIEENWSPC